MKEDKVKNEKKKENKNKVFIVIAILLLACVIGVTVKLQKKDDKVQYVKPENYVEETEDGIKLNKSSKLNEAKLVDGLLISNIQLTEKDGMTTLLADVTNKNEEKTGFKKLKVTLLDENNAEIATMTAFIGEIEAGKSTQLNASTTSNYIKAYDFKVTVD